MAAVECDDDHPSGRVSERIFWSTEGWGDPAVLPGSPRQHRKGSGIQRGLRTFGAEILSVGISDFFLATPGQRRACEGSG